MKTMKRIFAENLTPALLSALLVMPAFSAVSNGCDKEDNIYIAPELALCSTHVYNIGKTENPSNDTERAAMREVVALKTTLMTQQMKQQYDYLDATIRRFKTQLEKAILTTSLQAAGASNENSGNGGGRLAGNNGYNDPNVFLAGTQNCNNKATTAELFSCLQQNYNVIANMSNNGQSSTNELKRQLAYDCKLADSNYYTTNGSGIDKKCIDHKTISKNADFKDCLTDLISAIRKQSDHMANAQRQQPK